MIGIGDIVLYHSETNERRSGWPISVVRRKTVGVAVVTRLELALSFPNFSTNETDVVTYCQLGVYDFTQEHWKEDMVTNIDPKTLTFYKAAEDVISYKEDIIAAEVSLKIDGKNVTRWT